MKTIDIATCNSIYPLCCFDARIAEQFGIDCALLLNHLVCIDDNNKLLLRHYGERRQIEGVMQERGLIWSRHSLQYFSRLFPFYRPGKILNVLEKMKKIGLIELRPSLTDGFYWVAVLIEGDKDGE